MAAHICRTTLIASICAAEFPMPGIDELLVHHLCVVWNMSESPTRPHLIGAWNIRHRSIVETEIVDFANKLDNLFMLYDKRFSGYTEIITKYNNHYIFFKSNRDKIVMFYPYIDIILGEVIDDWRNSSTGQNIQNSDVEESKTFKPYLV
jgi:hypothetical protein